MEEGGINRRARKGGVKGAKKSLCDAATDSQIINIHFCRHSIHKIPENCGMTVLF